MLESVKCKILKLFCCHWVVVLSWLLLGQRSACCSGDVVLDQHTTRDLHRRSSLCHVNVPSRLHEVTLASEEGYASTPMQHYNSKTRRCTSARSKMCAIAPVSTCVWAAHIFIAVVSPCLEWWACFRALFNS